MATDKKPMQADYEYPVINDLMQFRMFTAVPNREGYNAQLFFGITTQGNPRISFIPNLDLVENPTAPKIVGIGMNPTTFDQFVKAFSEILAKGEKNTHGKLHNYRREKGRDYPKSGKIDQETLDLFATLHYGIDEEGMAWIAVQHKQVPNMRFMFESSIYHAFVKPDGERLTADEGSRAAASSTLDLLSKGLVKFMMAFRPPYEGGKAGGKDPAKAKTGGTTFTTDESFIF